MKRRIALKQMALYAGGMLVIPSCDFSEERILAAYEKLQITDAHYKTLSKVVETILPGGEIRGGRELNIQDFVLVMANDCLSEENQLRYTSGLKQFDPYVQKNYRSRFEKMQQSKAEEVFQEIVKSKKADPENQGGMNQKLAELSYFLETSKRYTLQGYLNSEYFMTEIMPYKMIPGGFQGEIPIKPSEKINING